MENEFKQVTVNLFADGPQHILKVSSLKKILDKYEFRDIVFEHFRIDEFKSQAINIGNVHAAYKYVKSAHEKYEKRVLIAERKNLEIDVEYENGTPKIYFIFSEGRIVDEQVSIIRAKAEYNSKNSFFEEYKMSMYANYLNERLKLPELLQYNLNYLKEKAIGEKNFNGERYYRLLSIENKHFVRGITSDRYKEYGIDFLFFVVCVVLHKKMLNDKGTNYEIVDLAISESKLNFIVKDKKSFKVPHIGRASLSFSFSTNELGNGSLNVTSTLKVENDNDETIVYLLPREEKNKDIRMRSRISHTNKLSTVLNQLNEFENILDLPQDFINDVIDLKRIKYPDELRFKIQSKIENSKSELSQIKELKDIFKSKIDNSIENFSKLLQMCKVAEALDIEYDLKEKLRYLISDIILYGNERK